MQCGRAVPYGSVRRLPFENTRVTSLNVSVKFTWKSVVIERDGAPLQSVSGQRFRCVSEYMLGIFSVSKDVFNHRLTVRL